MQTTANWSNYRFREAGRRRRRLGWSKIKGKQHGRETAAGGRGGRGPHVHPERGCPDGDSAPGQHQGPVGGGHFGGRCLPEGQKLSAGLFPAIHVLKGNLSSRLFPEIWTNETILNCFFFLVRSPPECVRVAGGWKWTVDGIFVAWWQRTGHDRHPDVVRYLSAWQTQRRKGRFPGQLNNIVTQ